ncbi:MAG: hypothetical protein M1828_006032 [Chrysothrix sp. TS-e1954]|nr:MAG: hypothetical protein M1828_006032 [Chrysothrix sp. TS-e1954]
MSSETPAGILPKVRPKNTVRKTKEEREALEREQAERHDARLRLAREDRAADEASRNAKYGFNERIPTKAWHDRGRGDSVHGRGGRGGFMGQTSRAPRESRGKAENGGEATEERKTPVSKDAAPGSQEQEAPESSAPRSSKRGGRSQREPKVKFGPRIKQEQNRDADEEGDVVMKDTRTQPPLPEYWGAISSDSDDYKFDRRVDIAQLDNLSTSDSDVSLKGRLHGATRGLVGHGGFMPIRLPRSQHRDHVVGINTEASAATVTGSKRKGKEAKERRESSDGSDDDAPIRSSKKGKGRVKSKRNNGTTIKREGGGGGDPQPTTSASETQSNGEDDVQENGVGGARESDAQPLRSRKRKKPIIAGKPRPYQTEEEFAEEQNRASELRTLQKELGNITIKPSEDTEGAHKGSKPTRENNIFLWQFPPRLPELVKASSLKSQAQRDKTTADGDVAVTSESKLTHNAPGEETIKMEEDPDGMPDLLSEAEPRFPAGRVGKLRVHKSGRTTLDWAGTTLEVNMGIDAQFLQTAILTTLKEQGPSIEAPSREDKARGKDGQAVSMGQIRGKFVATPYWEELL